MDPLDVVSAAPWRSVAFTTYALSLSFFEAVVLDRLVRGGGQSALILADPEGVRAGLSEAGARRAGRDYEIEPVACLGGVFHPKLSVFASLDDAHLLVGSGNLTFGGWGGNLELTEHLHPSFAADAFDDAADFFELLTLSDRIRTEAGSACLELAETLRAATRGASRVGNIRLLHNVGGSIAADLVSFVDDLGGARRITVVSPYHDLDGRGLDGIAAELQCDDIVLHAHPEGTVRGTGANCWPFDAVRARSAVTIDAPFAADKRPLHAKSIEILCRRGRLVLSGSANATHAGLFGANVEASVLRLQRGVLLGWTVSPADAPERPEVELEEEEADDQPMIGIIRAALKAGRVEARVLSPNPRGRVKVFVRTVRRTRDLGWADIHPDGHFSVDAPTLEQDAWESGRLVIRVEQNLKMAEGFISIAAASELIRRVGPMATRIFAILAGSDTPADVAAMLAWFREDPDRLPRAASPSGGGNAEQPEAPATFVHTHSLQAGGAGSGARPTDGGGAAAWRHAMALLRSAFSVPRGPWQTGAEADDDDDEDQSTRERRARQQDRDNAKSLEHFEALLPRMLDPKCPAFDPLLALAMTHFVTDRIRPPAAKVRLWLATILPAVTSFGTPEAEQAVAALVLAYGTDGRPDGAARARRALLAGHADFSALATLSLRSVPAFADLLGGTFEPAPFVEAIGRTQTIGEEIRAYLAAVSSGQLSVQLPSLSKSPHWPRLLRAVTDPAMFAQFYLFDVPPTSCPRCHMQFPRATAEDLSRLGIGTCCGHILLSRAL
ncbi:hypothetical protein AB2M62_07370 [Sphingomonas sp. MMS12-HWE2-04]|uniref:hypothetical protein n=1 Tax=Sphingomonas sp. MMS12-HWE2-04 TaxID=3234199 RepID=UPI0038510FD3